MHKLLKYKRHIAVMTLFVMIFLFVSHSAEAALNIPSRTSDIRAIDLDRSIGEIIRRIVNFIGIIGGVILVGLGMWHGIVAATSGKNPAKRAEAWDAVKWYIMAAAFFFAVPLLLGVVLRLMNV